MDLPTSRGIIRLGNHQVLGDRKSEIWSGSPMFYHRNPWLQIKTRRTIQNAQKYNTFPAEFARHREQILLTILCRAPLSLSPENSENSSLGFVFSFQRAAQTCVRDPRTDAAWRQNKTCTLLTLHNPAVDYGTCVLRNEATEPINWLRRQRPLYGTIVLPSRGIAAIEVAGYPTLPHGCVLHNV